MTNFATVKHAKTAPAPATMRMADHGALYATPAQFKQAALELGYGQGFANAMDEMARCEGTGRAKNEGDGAGLTFCGLTTRYNLKGYSAAQCNAMSLREVLQIYHNNYWSNIGLDKFQGVAPAVAFRCFDAHVNSGAGGMSHMLTWVCDRLHIPVSGGRSSDKMQAISDAIKDGKISEDAVHKECTNARMWWYRVRCASKWGTFGNGWMNRLKKVAHRVGIIRGLSPDDSFNYSFDSSLSTRGNPYPSGSHFFKLFGNLTDSFKLLMGTQTTTEPCPGKSILEQEQEGEKFAKSDSKNFTKFFGEPKDTYNSNTKSDPKKDSPQPASTRQKVQNATGEKADGLEALLAKISLDTRAIRAEEAKKKSEEKDAKPWWEKR